MNVTCVKCAFSGILDADFVYGCRIMVSFLKKLKGAGLAEEGGTPAEEREAALASVGRLDVDVYQTSSAVVIYAPIYGADIADVDVSIEGDNDVVTIAGTRKRPEEHAFNNKPTPEGRYYAEEIVWGDFYRQIILPEEIDTEKAEAKLKNGILILILPLLSSTGARKKMSIMELDESV
jgi:HSP20 family molecular chaperone IbpA